MAYESDDELEGLKRWWDENGRAVILGVVIAVAGVFGWNQWQSYTRDRAEQASAEYMAFLEQVANEEEGAIQRGQALVEQYGSTAYGPLTALWLAQLHVKQDQLDQAAAQLRWASAEADTEAMRDLARLRLARVLLAQDKAAEALALVEKAPVGAYASEFQEVRGDVLAAQGRADDAAAAYRAALAEQAVSGQRRSLIELKLNDLGADQEPVS